MRSVLAMSDDTEHTMTCRECGEAFDKRSLAEVFIHEHDGFVPEDGIDRIGEECPGE